MEHTGMGGDGMRKHKGVRQGRTDRLGDET
jgi:hypothetical protein